MNIPLSLPFSINIGFSSHFNVLGKVLGPCTGFALKYLMIFLSTWEEHLEAVFK